jgi:hypothetical protein
MLNQRLEKCSARPDLFDDWGDYTEPSIQILSNRSSFLCREIRTAMNVNSQMSRMKSVSDVFEARSFRVAVRSIVRAICLMEIG